MALLEKDVNCGRYLLHLLNGLCEGPSKNMIHFNHCRTEKWRNQQYCITSCHWRSHSIINYPRKDSTSMCFYHVYKYSVRIYLYRLRIAWLILHVTCNSKKLVAYWRNIKLVGRNGMSGHNSKIKSFRPQRRSLTTGLQVFLWKWLCRV